MSTSCCDMVYTSIFPFCMWFPNRTQATRYGKPADDGGLSIIAHIAPAPEKINVINASIVLKLSAAQRHSKRLECSAHHEELQALLPLPTVQALRQLDIITYWNASRTGRRSMVVVKYSSH